jgi:uncharacterized delta-60 repeat protein
MMRLDRWGITLAALLCSLFPTAEVVAQAGSYDTSWRPSGRTVLALPNTAASSGVAIDDVGGSLSLIVARLPQGSTQANSAVVRLLPDGALDTGFGSGGYVDFFSSLLPTLGIVTGDGDGLAFDDWNASNPPLIWVYLKRGTFQRSGFRTFVRTDLASGSRAFAIAPAPGNRLVIAGGAGPSDTMDFGVTVLDATTSFADLSFADGGLRLPIGGSATRDYATAVTADALGRIVVAGTLERPSSTRGMAVVRFLPDGNLDNTFATGGLLDGVAGLRGYPRAMAVDENAGILIAFDDDLAATSLRVVRVTQDGLVDDGFGPENSGVASAGFGPGIARACCLVVQPDGAIVVGGTTNLLNGNSRFGIARFDAAGQPDPTFGVGGKTEGGFSTDLSRSSAMTAMRLDTRLRLMVLGTDSAAGQPTRTGVAMIRTGVAVPETVFANGFEAAQ